MDEELPTQQQEKSKVGLIIIIIVIALLFIGILVFFLFYNPGEDQPPDNHESENNGEISISILDKSTVRNAEGIPIVVRIVADVDAGTCKLSYEGELIGEGEEIAEKGRITLTHELDNRFDLNLWSICCDKKPILEFTNKSESTTCLID